MFGEEKLFWHLLLDATTPHIASPGVHVDDECKKVVMHFLGLTELAVQETKLVATSTHGLKCAASAWGAGGPPCEPSNTMASPTMPRVFSRSVDGRTNFEQRPQLFVSAMRHSAVVVRNGDLLTKWRRF